MTTARTVVRNALTFGLNKLSPGEAEDADLFGRCLEALNDIADELNGGKSVLFREILTASSTISAATALLGTAWSSLAPGDQILGATYVASGQDNPMWELTMQQYHDVPNKDQTGQPEYWAHDGLATVYLYPVPTGHVITIRTKQVISDFADLDTNYSMPKGYSSALSALLAERMAPTLAPTMFQTARAAAAAARRRIHAQAIDPAVIGANYPRRNILQGE